MRKDKLRCEITIRQSVECVILFDNTVLKSTRSDEKRFGNDTTFSLTSHNSTCGFSVYPAQEPVCTVYSVLCIDDLRLVNL